MPKVVINRCYGGYGLSDEAVMRYAELSGITLYPQNDKFCTSFYLCPPEEYEAIYEQERKNLDISPDRFKRSNELYFSIGDIPRDDPTLIRVIEELGDAANGNYAELKIVEIPDGVSWEIDYYDGMESIHESHKTWS